MRNINIRNIPDDVYFLLLKKKVELRARTWLEFIIKLLELAERGEGDDGERP